MKRRLRLNLNLSNKMVISSNLATLTLSSTKVYQTQNYVSPAFIKRNQQTYYEYLSNIHAEGDYKTWIIFLSGVIETVQEAVEIARSIAAIFEEDLKKNNAMGRTSENALVIYVGLFDNPTISIEEATKKLDISIATIGRLLEKLCEEGILSNLDNRTLKKVFIYKRYINVFNKD